MAESQYHAFKDCVARRIITGSALSSPNEDASDLDEFSSYLAQEVWPIIPTLIQDASYETRNNVPDIDTLPLNNIPPSFSDSLTSYGICADWDEASLFLRKVLEDYLQDACAPPPVWSSTRTTECEICEREIPLTYHHLIPRSVHSKALKKKWHPESMINSVAWLCRPCHTVVHRSAPNEELARSFYTVDLLLEREDIQRWRKYAAKQRYGVKRG
ncbi:hypothetical protein DENSPDRAFT_839772 [Dentipellis sp. KUC8613]|nr:hypothetical protein DENSPDRAFT_839772 [Dentipellis sp. KUC8613]